MSKRQQYWPLEVTGQDVGYRLELRAQLAWDLLRHFGVVAGRPEGEDSAGRSVLDLQSVQETVSRCFSLADEFVTTAESRELIAKSPIDSDEEAFRHAGELQRIKSRAEYPVGDMPQSEMTTEDIQMRARHAKERSELRAKQRQEESQNKPQ